MFFVFLHSGLAGAADVCLDMLLDFHEHAELDVQLDFLEILREYEDVVPAEEQCELLLEHFWPQHLGDEHYQDGLQDSTYEGDGVKLSPLEVDGAAAPAAALSCWWADHLSYPTASAVDQPVVVDIAGRSTQEFLAAPVGFSVLPLAQLLGCAVAYGAPLWGRLGLDLAAMAT